MAQTLIGRLGGDPELRFTKSGKPVCSFNMVTSRKVKKDDGSWEDTETTWYRVEMWDQFAENVAESLTKGCAVIVHGRVYMDSYEKNDGSVLQSLKVAAYSVGPDLKWAKAPVKKVERKSGRDSGSEDPWGSPPVADEPPF